MNALNVVRGLLITGLALSAVACAKQGGTGVKSSDSQLSAGENSYSDSSGNTIFFVNTLGKSLGRVDSVVRTGSSITVQLVSPATRVASVQINLDASGKFVSIAKVAQPYMCYDISKPACAQINSGGIVQNNCSSPIVYTGALNGSVDGLTQALTCP